jgi:hypothetical protein
VIDRFIEAFQSRPDLLADQQDKASGLISESDGELLLRLRFRHSAKRPDCVTFPAIF